MLRKVGMVPLKNPQHFVTNDFHLISDSAEIFDRHSESLWIITFEERWPLLS